MPIQRSGPTPNFVEYVSRYALVPYFNNGNLTAILNLQPQFIEIPRFQRGVSWNNDNIIEFFSSQSILLGNVIMGQFQIPINRFNNLPNTIGTYNYLIDGLQRLSVGTLILKALHETVLKTNCEFPNESQYFVTLNSFVSNFAPIYLHNHEELSNHPRVAIQNPYRVLYEEFLNYLRSQLSNGSAQSISNDLIRLFVSRQVAIDIYFNFSSPLEIMSTFLGINTVRVDLNTIDLVRSNIIEKGEISGWNSSQIDDIENRFSDVFTNPNGTPDGSLYPFIGVVWEVFKKSRQNVLFPSWSGILNYNQVEDFLDFVENFKISPTVDNPFIREIKNTGSAPYAILISVYYYQYITNSVTPSFFTGGSNENSELHRFLISCYRAIIEGGIGKSRPIAEDVFIKNDILAGTVRPYQTNTFPKSLTLVAEEMAHKFSNMNLSSTYNQQVLTTLLNRANKTKAKLIFNAILLPLKSNGWGGAFTPITFGASSRRREFNVDHLIPDAMAVRTNPGFEEINTMRNFAPLPCNQNRVAKATNCSSKLLTNGIYSTYINTPQGYPVHPYCVWLVNQHAVSYSAQVLDNQLNIEQGSNPDLGNERINYIVQELLIRL